MLRLKKPKPARAIQSGAIFYDDRWIKKREEGFGAWVNFALSVCARPGFSHAAVFPAPLSLLHCHDH